MYIDNISPSPSLMNKASLFWSPVGPLLTLRKKRGASRQRREGRRRNKPFKSLSKPDLDTRNLHCWVPYYGFCIMEVLKR